MTGDAMGDTATSYATDVTKLLWPHPWHPPYVTRRRHSGGAAHRDAYVFPSTRRPRLLLPADSSAATVMLERLGQDRSRLARPSRALLVRAVRSRLFGHVRWPVVRSVAPSTEAQESIESFLANVLGTEVHVGVILGPRRANQKPVLQLFGPQGRLLGFAKLGQNALTAPLIRKEADALAYVAGKAPTSFAVPRVLHTGQWRGLELLVMSPLSGASGRHITAAQRTAAMREVAGLNGISSCALGRSGFWARLQESLQELGDERTRDRLARCAEEVALRWGEADLQQGCWHGDWGAWNMAITSDVLQIWDWERFDTGVPLGFDAVHLGAQAVRPEKPDHAAAQTRFLQTAPRLLADQGVRPETSTLVLVLYLMEISVRYAEALRHGGTPVLLRRSAWALSLVETLLRESALDLTGATP
jgi:hypothetical protein